MHGSNTANPVPNYGTQGVTAPTNDPPGLYESCEMVDLQGNFWIFGGLDANNQEQTALWKFDTLTNMWTWMKGPNLTAQAGVYGTMGVPSPANFPGSRAWGVATWTDATGNLWIFGGAGYDAFGGFGMLADLWKYNIATNEWTWMSGPNTINFPGNYGTPLVPAPTNAPPARNETSAAWTSNNGDLWMYGGGDWNGQFNDMWKYSPSTGMWTFMHGSTTVNALPSYGTQTISSPSNTPGARFCYGRWKDLNGNLWLFGGSGANGFYADMWMFDISLNEWAWMAGSNTTSDFGTFTQKCVPGNGYPGCRTENRCCWTDDCGRFWQYGGMSSGKLNDLWMFDPNTLQFTWVGGTTLFNQPGVYGTQLVPAPTNYPDGSAGSVGFRDLQGNFWMFGGWSLMLDKHNAVWRYVPDPACPASTTLQVAINHTNPACAPQTISFNASTNNLTWNYQWDFGDPSTAADTASTPASNYTYTTPGTYTVTLIATGTGCASGTDTATAVLVIGGANALDLGNDTAICGAVNLALDAGTAADYSWSTGSISQTINVTATGTYWVTVNQFTCPATDSIVITNATAPDLGPDTSICGGSVVFDVGVATSYLWNTGDTTQTINAGISGQYYVVVTISNCTFSDTVDLVVLPTPQVDLGADTTVCGSVNLTLDAGNPGTTYSWSTGATSQTIAAAAAGTYWVFSSNAACSDADTIVISAVTPPALGSDTTVCAGTTITLDGGPGTSYSWSTGAVSQTITVSTAGLYWVNVTTGSCMLSDSTQVFVTPLPVVSLGADTMLCPNSNYQLDAGNPGASYQWSNGPTTSSITINSAGTYSVTVTENNCSAGDAIVIAVASPVLLADEVFCGDAEIVLEAGSAGPLYSWSTGETTPSISVADPGMYWVTVTEGSCVQSDTAVVSGLPGEGMLYVPNTFTPDGNGHNETFAAKGEGFRTFQMRIFNRWGELIFESDDIAKAWDGRYKGTLVQQDTYVYVVEYETECGAGKRRRTGNINVLR
jgi:gliding motility-associated-like protein